MTIQKPVKKPKNKVLQYFSEWNWGKYVVWLLIISLIRMVIGCNAEPQLYKPVNIPPHYEIQITEDTK